MPQLKHFQILFYQKKTQLDFSSVHIMSKDRVMRFDDVFENLNVTVKITDDGLLFACELVCAITGMFLFHGYLFYVVMFYVL